MSEPELPADVVANEVRRDEKTDRDEQIDEDIKRAERLAEELGRGDA